MKSIDLRSQEAKQSRNSFFFRFSSGEPQLIDHIISGPSKQSLDFVVSLLPY